MDTILQYLLGAGIFSVLATQVATSIRERSAQNRERRTQERERIALMSLVHMEIMHNELIIERLRESQDPLTTGEITLLHDDAWRENRKRITQLEDERAIEYLGMYYTSIGTLLSENRLYQELDDYSSDTDVEEIFEALGTNLGPLARYSCERQTEVVRVWSLGMVVTAGVWQPEPNVESTWNQRQLPPPDETDDDS